LNIILSTLKSKWPCLGGVSITIPHAHLFSPIHAACSAHLILLIWISEYYMLKSTIIKLLVMQSSPFSVHFLPLDLNIFLSTHTSCPCSYLQMTHSFAPIQTSKPLIILYISIYLFRKQIGRKEILDQMETDIPWI